MYVYVCIYGSMTHTVRWELCRTSALWNGSKISQIGENVKGVRKVPTGFMTKGTCGYSCLIGALTCAINRDAAI